MKRLMLLLGLAVAACSETAEPVSEAGIDESVEAEELYEFTDDSTFEPIGPASEGDDQTSDVAVITDDGVVIRYVGPFEGGTALAAEDAFTANLQLRETSIRAQNNDAMSFDDVIPHYRDDVFSWQSEQKIALTAVIEELLPVLNQIDQHLPEDVLLVLTGEVVEGGLPHTRGNAIIFAGGDIPMPGPGDEEGQALASLFLHELHHVMSRANPELHDDTYSLIGFEPCVFSEPEGLRAIRLTNPDAPEYKHYAPVTPDGGSGVIPYLYATHAFTTSQPSSLGDVFGFGLVPVSFSGGVCETSIPDASGLLQPDDVPAFLNLIGGNTGYIIHPEETLSDNFVHWALGRTDLPNPEIPEAVGMFWLRPGE